jgi:hypothetical protein
VLSNDVTTNEEACANTQTKILMLITYYTHTHGRKKGTVERRGRVVKGKSPKKRFMNYLSQVSQKYSQPQYKYVPYYRYRYTVQSVKQVLCPANVL